MKPTNVIDMQRTGDLGGDKVAMKFDENSIAHIMSVLTDLYSDPELAVIREYSTNARDSHIMAGTVRPIEISLPNGMSPYFKVKDFGLGMSVKDVEDVYSKYGASTKRDDNIATGMLGLGCKSALTYTSQFTITAVKAGIKTVVVVSRVEDGTGVMEIVDTTPTNEPNGVEISIPVKQGNQFAYKAARFFRFWEEGTVLVDGEAPARVEGQNVTANMMTVKNLGVDADVIVMGGVPYPVDTLFTGHRSYNGFTVVAFVEIGEVNFTPSRESLQNTPRTIATIDRLRKEFAAELEKVIRADIEAQPDHPAALAKFMELTSIFQNSMPINITYKGDSVPLRWNGNFTVWHRRRSRYSMSQSGYMDHNTLSQSIIVTNYNGIKITPRHKAKMTGWMTDNNLLVDMFVICDDQPGLPWVQNKNVVSWADILAYKLPSSGPRAASVPTYDCYTKDGYAALEADDIDTKKPVLFTGTRPKYQRNTLVALTKVLGDATIVVLGDNRLAKFQKAFPKASGMNDAVLARLKQVTDALTPADKVNLSMDYYDKGLLSFLDDTLVDDPAIKAGIKTAKGLVTSNAIAEYAEVTQAARSIGHHIPAISAPSILNDYPLVKGSGNSNRDHAVLYMNAVFAAKQNGEI